jgi:hypothetical protein
MYTNGVLIYRAQPCTFWPMRSAACPPAPRQHCPCGRITSASLSRTSSSLRLGPPVSRHCVEPVPAPGSDGPQPVLDPTTNRTMRPLPESVAASCVCSKLSYNRPCQHPSAAECHPAHAACGCLQSRPEGPQASCCWARQARSSHLLPRGIYLTCLLAAECGSKLWPDGGRSFVFCAAGTANGR